MTIYIVTSDYGQYEDSYESIDGIFEDKDDAEACKLAMEQTFKDVEGEKVYEVDEESLSSEELEIYYNKMRIIESAYDFNSCNIKEYETIPSSKNK